MCGSMVRKKGLPVQVIIRILMKYMSMIISMIGLTPIHMILLRRLREQKGPHHTRMIIHTHTIMGHTPMDAA